METLILTIHILIALGLVITVLLQRSEGGGLGIGGGGTGGLSADVAGVQCHSFEEFFASGFDGGGGGGGDGAGGALPLPLLATHGEAARGLGVGRKILRRLAAVAVERGCRRLDFSVIEMNPARGFYEAHGCRHLGDWLPYRVSDADLEKLAERPSRR